MLEQAIGIGGNTAARVPRLFAIVWNLGALTLIAEHKKKPPK